MKFIDIKTFLEIRNKVDKPIVAIFYAKWCHYCEENIPFIKNYVEYKQINDAYFVDIGEYEADVWEETGNTLWALRLVPTTRIYLKNEVVFEHINVIDKDKLDKMYEIFQGLENVKN